MTVLTIASRFMGPAGSANGGYVAGRLRAYVAGPGDVTAVSLRRPPPVDRELSVERDDTAATLLDGRHLVAEAGPGELEHAPVAPVSVEDARAAEPAYRGLVQHPFPTCFVCGTRREPGDALCLRPGRQGPGRTACTWVPDPRLADEDGLVAPEYVWSALDCPGGWSADLEARPLVLGTMTAVCEDAAVVGRAHVVVGRLLGEQGRKTFTASALYDATGRLLARAEQVWIAVDPTAFQRLAAPLA